MPTKGAVPKKNINGDDSLAMDTIHARPYRGPGPTKRVFQPAEQKRSSRRSVKRAAKSGVKRG
jgi:hypothetical protein